MQNPPPAAPPAATPPTPVVDGLSDRESQVALALAAGSTNREIADALRISIKTVDTHRAHILKKLKLKNNVMLAHHMIRAGYVPL